MGFTTPALPNTVELRIQIFAITEVIGFRPYSNLLLSVEKQNGSLSMRVSFEETAFIKVLCY